MFGDQLEPLIINCTFARIPPRWTLVPKTFLHKMKYLAFETLHQNSSCKVVDSEVLRVIHQKAVFYFFAIRLTF